MRALEISAAVLVIFVLAAGCAGPHAAQPVPPAEEVATTVAPPEEPQKALRSPDVIYVPTPTEVVKGMLTLAKAGPEDVLYDLGSGDGRIVIAAVRDFGVKRATGIDINPDRIREANANAIKANVADRTRFLNEDLFEADFRDATIITLYLLPTLNLRLLPKLLDELQPGTRIVSNDFDMGTWKAAETIYVDGRDVYLWTIPERGTPEFAAAMAATGRE